MPHSNLIRNRCVPVLLKMLYWDASDTVFTWEQDLLFYQSVLLHLLVIPHNIILQFWRIAVLLPQQWICICHILEYVIMKGEFKSCVVQTKVVNFVCVNRRAFISNTRFLYAHKARSQSLMQGLNGYIDGQTEMWLLCQAYKIFKMY